LEAARIKRGGERKDRLVVKLRLVAGSLNIFSMKVVENTDFSRLIAAQV